jgi:hypothetical protein
MAGSPLAILLATLASTLVGPRPTSTPFYSGSKGLEFSPATNDSRKLIAAAQTLARQIWRDGFAFSKAGVTFDDLIAPENIAPGLFDVFLRGMIGFEFLSGRLVAFNLQQTGDGMALQASVQRWIEPRRVFRQWRSPWSNGQTEGQITKLKLVKRQMYGRGKIDLLQARVIGFQ